MAQVVLACSRDSAWRVDVDALAAALGSDRAVTVSDDPTAVLAVIGDSQAVQVDRVPNPSVRLGAFDHARLSVAADEARVDADAVASRTIWWVHTDDLFVASTSQRAVTLLLGSYVPEPNARTWMLSSGTLGPGLAWDRRVRPVAAGGSVRLDRRRWTVEVTESPVRFACEPISVRAAAARLDEELERTAESLSRLDWSHWTLALSGGVDSRALLLMLDGRPQPATVTWAAPGDVERRGSDAQVAASLARHTGAPHRVIELDGAARDPRDVVERFVLAGEGRIDHLAGYVDGMALWDTLRDQGHAGIVRGDEVFGWQAVHTPAGARHAVGLTTLHDLDQFGLVRDEVFEAWGPQDLPGGLRRRPSQSLASWRDALYQAFRAPAILAALTQVKSSHVELAAPLLTSGLVELVRSMPDRSRTEKQAFRRWVAVRTPRVPYANRTAKVTVGGHVAASGVAPHLLDVVRTGADVIPSGLLSELERRVAGGPARSSSWRAAARDVAQRSVPRSVRRQVRERVLARTVDWHQVLLRTYIVVRMDQVLRQDAAASRIARARWE